MDQQQSKQLVVEKIKEANNVLIGVSANPSVDQLASALGLTFMLNKLGKHASAVFSGDIPPSLNFLDPDKTFDGTVDALRDFVVSLDKEKADKLRYKVEDDVVKIFITPYKTKLSKEDFRFSQGDFNVDVVVALGVHHKEDLDNAIKAHGRILHDATVLTINAGAQASNLGSVNWQNEGASSLSEMLVSISEAFQGGLLDSQISTAFLTGIVSATDRFRNAQTSPKVMTMAAQLMAAGANQQLIASNLATQEPDFLNLDDGPKLVPKSELPEEVAPEAQEDETELDLHAPMPVLDDNVDIDDIIKEAVGDEAGDNEETVLAASKDPEVLDTAYTDSVNDDDKVTDELEQLKNELSSIGDETPNSEKERNREVKLVSDDVPVAKDTQPQVINDDNPEEALREILPELVQEEKPAEVPASEPSLRQEVEREEPPYIPKLSEVEAQLNDLVGPSQANASPLPPPMQSYGGPQQEVVQQQFNTPPPLPPQTPIISQAKGASNREMLSQPQMGGTFNATSSQEELEKAREQELGRNNTILSHSLPTGLQVPETRAPEVPVAQMNQEEINKEVHDQAADIEAARRAVEEAAGAVYNTANNPVQALSMPPLQQNAPMNMSQAPQYQQQEYPQQPPQFNQQAMPPQYNQQPPMPPQFNQQAMPPQYNQQPPMPPQFNQQPMPQQPNVAAGPPPPPPPPLSGGAPPTAPRISPANLGSFAPGNQQPPQQPGRATSYISNAPMPQNPLNQLQQPPRQ